MMFIVLYRWKIIPGSEEVFQQAWQKVTEYITWRIMTLWVRGCTRAMTESGMHTPQWKSEESRKLAADGSSNLDTNFKKMRSAVETR